MTEDLRYPVGKFVKPTGSTPNSITAWRTDLAALYSWHSRHHAAHVDNLRARNKW